MTQTASANSPLAADCTNCMGICCVAPGFERGGEFALSKPAQSPCPHLSHDNGCKIHDDLVKKGFPGCAQFDCKGAGQYLTQFIFPQQSWRDSEAVSARIAETYRRLRAVFNLLELFNLARNLPLSSEQETARYEMVCKLDPLERWNETTLQNAEIAGLFSEARLVFQSFRSAV